MRKSILAAAGAIALVVASTVTGAASAGQVKVDVCHYADDTDTYHLISVADPAVDSHVAHGDGFIDGPVPGMEGYIFDATCQPIPEPVDEVLLAQAWVDQDFDHEFTEGDALIAQMWLDPNTNVARVVTNVHPSSPDGGLLESLVPFAVTEHTGVATYSALQNSWNVYNVNVGDSGASFTIQDQTLSDGSGFQRYAEDVDRMRTGSADRVGFNNDGSLRIDNVQVDPASPSQPQSEPIFINQPGGAEDADDFFLDTEVFPPTP